MHRTAFRLLLLTASCAGFGGPLQAQEGSPEQEVLQRFIGQWNASLRGERTAGEAKLRDAGPVARKWVVDRHFVQESGPGYEAYLTYDQQEGQFRAWYFHANGHVWELAGPWDPGSATLTLSADLDGDQTICRTYRFTGDKSHECAVSWTDADNHSSTFCVYRYTAGTPAAARSAEPPAAAPAEPTEMRIFAADIGSWLFTGEIDNQGKKTPITGQSEVERVLGGRFLQSQASVREPKSESIRIYGFDTNKHAYRSWYFSPEGNLPSSGVGTWDEKNRTMTWKYASPNGWNHVVNWHRLDNDTVDADGKFSTEDGKLLYSQYLRITRKRAK